MSEAVMASASSLSMADLAQVGVGGMAIRAKAGDVLFRPGDDCHGFIALRSGVIRVGLTSAAGRELVLYRVRPGDICLQNLRCLTEHQAYAAEGVAETDIEAVLLAPNAFDRLMAEDAAFRAAVLVSVARRFTDFEGVVEALAFTGLPARLATALLAHADPSGVTRMTHEALATEIGSAREAVSRQLAVFAHDGLVNLERGSVTLVNKAGLERIGAT